MILTTHCPTCRAPLVTKLPDSTTEAEAQAIASRLYCVPCAIEHQTQHTLTEAKPDATATALEGRPSLKGSSGEVFLTGDQARIE
jgi:hypothetical protein